MLNITRGSIEVTQYTEVSYLGCLFDEKCRGESMALKVIGKINGKLKFLWRKNKFLTPALRRLLCNALIQPHFDYAISAWYPNLQKKLLNKLQICQNKCIRFCLMLDNRSHIGNTEFREINWLPVQDRFEQCVNTHVFKQQNNLAPKYMNEVFTLADQALIRTRASSYKLKQPNRKRVSGCKAISYLGPKFWNRLPNDIKTAKSANGFKHKIKQYYFKELDKKDKDIFIYY